MGEISEMMLDGTLCSNCGEVFDDMVPKGFEDMYSISAPGHPRMCKDCKKMFKIMSGSEDHKRRKKDGRRTSKSNISR